MQSPIFLFPGQSSRDLAMLERARRMAPDVARVVLEEASDALGRDLVAHYRSDDPDHLRTSRAVQVGVFVTSHVHLEALRGAGIDASVSLGLSLGEYNHLVHIGALDFADAVRLVDARGQAYDEGPRGAMLAVFPASIEELEEPMARARAHGVLEAVNFNSPTQQVLAGDYAAIEHLEPILEDELAVSAVRIEDSVPMHCSIFRPAADRFRAALEAAPFRSPGLPYVPNVLATLEHSCEPASIRELLYRHVFTPVRFRESIELVARTFPHAAFVEVGPRAVIYGLLSRRWVSNARFKTDCLEHPEDGLRRAVAELAHAA